MEIIDYIYWGLVLFCIVALGICLWPLIIAHLPIATGMAIGISLFVVRFFWTK